MVVMNRQMLVAFLLIAICAYSFIIALVIVHLAHNKARFAMFNSTTAHQTVQWPLNATDRRIREPSSSVVHAVFAPEELSFEADFAWPPYVNVRREVDRQLRGLPTQNAVLNGLDHFRTLLEPQCLQQSQWLAAGDKAILVVVKTAPSRTKERAIIRSSFGAVRSQDGFQLRTVFVLGAMQQWRSKMPQLEAEAAEWGDLLVGDHQDHYFTNTWKLVNALKLGLRFCGRAVPFLYLVDDDYTVFPWKLVQEAQKHSPNAHLYAGNGNRVDAEGRVLPREVIRDPDSYWGKWAVTLREYPFDLYPPFCAAGSVLLSRRTLQELVLAIPHTALFVLDDVFTGILAYLLEIEPRHNSNFRAVPFYNETTEAEWDRLIAVHGYSNEQNAQIYDSMWKRHQGSAKNNG